MSKILVWEDGVKVIREALPGELPEVDPVAELARERARMVCTPMQGKLALGEAAWAEVEAWRDTYATWAQKVIINDAADWRRDSENMMFFAYLLNYTDEQMDTLFQAAMQVRA